MSLVTIPRHILGARSLSGGAAVDHEQRRQAVLLRTENKRQFLDVSGGVGDKVGANLYFRPTDHRDQGAGAELMRSRTTSKDPRNLPEVVSG